MSNEVVEGVVVEEVAAVEATDAVVEHEGNIPGTLFVEVWNTSSSRKEVLARFAALGYTLKYGSLGARAKSFKARGVALNAMPREKTKGRKGKGLDVAKLNAVAERIAQAKADADKVAAAAAAPAGEASAS